MSVKAFAETDSLHRGAPIHGLPAGKPWTRHRWLFIHVADEFLQGMMMANINKYAEADACART